VPAPTSWLTFLHISAGCFNSPSQLLFEQPVTDAGLMLPATLAQKPPHPPVQGGRAGNRTSRR
jgi:hypothetical protein